MGNKEKDEFPFDELQADEFKKNDIPFYEFEEDQNPKEDQQKAPSNPKVYNVDEAIKASKKLAIQIRDNKSKTPVRSKNVLKSTHVIREYNKLKTNKRIRVNIKYDFGAVQQKLLKIPNGKQALKELITDRLKANKLRFNSPQSYESFKKAAIQHGFQEQLDKVKIEVVSSKETKSKSVDDAKESSQLTKLASKPKRKRTKKNLSATIKKEQRRGQKRKASF